MVLRKTEPDSFLSKDEFAKRLREAREARGLSIEQLAKLACITPRRLANWEQGQGEQDVNRIFRLIAALGTGFDYFFYRDSGKREDSSRFGLKLRKARVSRFGTIKRAAYWCKVPQESWKAWERGEDMPSIPTLVDLARELCVSLDWLAGSAPVKTFAQHRKSWNANWEQGVNAYLEGVKQRKHSLSPLWLMYGHSFTDSLALSSAP